MKPLFPVLLLAIVVLAIDAPSGSSQVVQKKKLPNDTTTKQKNAATGSLPPASSTGPVQMKKTDNIIQGTTTKTKSKPGVQTKPATDLILDKKALPAQTKTLPPDLTRDKKSLPAQTQPLPGDIVLNKKSAGSLIKGNNQANPSKDSGTPVTLIKGLWIESFKFDRASGTLKAVFGNSGFTTINDGKYTIYQKTITGGLAVISSGSLPPIGPRGSSPVNVKASIGEDPVVFKVDVIGGGRSQSKDFTIQTTFVVTYQLPQWRVMAQDFRYDNSNELKGLGESFPNKLRSFGFEVNVTYSYHRFDYGEFLSGIFGTVDTYSSTKTIIKMRAVDPITNTFNNRKQAEAFRDEVRSVTDGVVTPVISLR